MYQDIEATLHCILSVQEAVDTEEMPLLGRLFSPEILGRLPQAGHNRVRRTALGVIGEVSILAPLADCLLFGARVIQVRIRLGSQVNRRNQHRC